LGAVGGVEIRRGGVFRLFNGDEGTDGSVAGVGAGVSGMDVGGFCSGGSIAFACSCGVIAIGSSASWARLGDGFGVRISLVDSSVANVGTKDRTDCEGLAVSAGAVSEIGTSEVWLPFTLSFVIIVKPAGRAREFLNSSAIFSSVSVEGILIVVPRADSRSRSRAKSGAGGMGEVLVMEIVFEVGAEGLGGGRGAEEVLLAGKLFWVSVVVSESRSGGA
jgi:hypothetical protein